MENKTKRIISHCTCLLLIYNPIFAYAGITLKSKDGAIIVARTVEWALSDAQHNKILIVPK